MAYIDAYITRILTTGHVVQEAANFLIQHFNSTNKTLKRCQTPSFIQILVFFPLLFFFFFFFHRRLDVGGRGGVLAFSPHGITSCTSLVDELISQSLFTWMTIGSGVDGVRPATRYAELGIPGDESSSPLMIFHWSCCLTAVEGTVAIGLLILLCFVGVLPDKAKNGRRMGRQAQRMAMAGSAMFQIIVLIGVSERRIVADISL